jgi:hypothetical protein
MRWMSSWSGTGALVVVPCQADRGKRGCETGGATEVRAVPAATGELAVQIGGGFPCYRGAGCGQDP